MTEEPDRTRWIWVALGLPAATIVAFAIAIRFGLENAFADFARSYLPPSLAAFANGAPFIGWGLLTLLCSGWLCYERARHHGIDGAHRWTLAIFFAPFLAILHAIASIMVAWPGCVLVGSF